MIHLSVHEQKSWWGKCIGLIGRKEPHAIMFYTRYGIHTLFLRFPIDLVVLDRDYTVGFLKKHIKPNTMALWPTKYDVVLELPKGTIEEKKIKLGEKIELEFTKTI